MKLSIVYLLFGTPFAFAAIPAYCTQLTGLVSSMSKDACATSYCSSYLKIPVSTVTKSVTSTVATSTITVMSDGACPTTMMATTPTTTVTVTGAPVTSSCAALAMKKMRRTVSSAIDTCTTPAVLKTVSSTLISSGCSCFSVPTSTTTVTNVMKATGTSTVTVTATPMAAPSPVTVTKTVTPTKYILPPASAASGATDGRQYNTYGAFDVPYGDIFNQDEAVCSFNKNCMFTLQDCLDYCESFNTRFPNQAPCIAVAFLQSGQGTGTDTGYKCFPKFTIAGCGRSNSDVTFAVKVGADYPPAVPGTNFSPPQFL